MQDMANDHQVILNQAIGIGPVDWRSPLKHDEYAEYSGQAAFDRAGVILNKTRLDEFWPSQGPHWDALGVANTGEAVLVEAKAHVAELFSNAVGASAEKSISRIRESLIDTMHGLGAEPGLDWSLRFYQYANRLAHAYLLERLNDVPVKLVFLNFVGDDKMRGTETAREWQVAHAVLLEAMGLRGRKPSFVVDAHVDVRSLPQVLA
jgi:hypothetical protein